MRRGLTEGPIYSPRVSFATIANLEIARRTARPVFASAIPISICILGVAMFFGSRARLPPKNNGDVVVGTDGVCIHALLVGPPARI